MLSRLALMVQAAVLYSQFLDLFPSFDDCGVTPELGVGWCDVADALVVSMIVIMIRESADLHFKGNRTAFQPYRVGNAAVTLKPQRNATA